LITDQYFPIPRSPIIIRKHVNVSPIRGEGLYPTNTFDRFRYTHARLPTITNPLNNYVIDTPQFTTMSLHSRQCLNYVSIM